MFSTVNMQVKLKNYFVLMALTAFHAYWVCFLNDWYSPCFSKGLLFHIIFAILCNDMFFIIFSKWKLFIVSHNKLYGHWVHQYFAMNIQESTWISLNAIDIITLNYKSKVKQT